MKRDLNFSSGAAEMYGVDGAIMLHHIAFWVFRNKLNNTNIIEGQTWTWNSARAFSEIFPFWSKDQVRRILINLEKKGAIISGLHNRAGWDRTKWYTITKEVEKFYQFEVTQNANSKTKKSKLRNRKMDDAKPRKQYQMDNQIPNQIENQIVLPFESEGFKNLWNLWKVDRRNRNIKKYTELGEQTALKKLQDDSNNNERTAVSMIKNAIANGYQGIFPDKKRKSTRNSEEKFDKSKLLDHLEQTRDT